MIRCFCGHPWANNHSWINTGQQFMGYAPDLFSALPLEIQMRIVRAMGPNVFQALTTMEKISQEWYNIAGQLWELFTQADFSLAEIEAAKQELTRLGKETSGKNIYSWLVYKPIDVRISFLSNLPQSAGFDKIGYIWVSVPDGRFLVTQGRLLSKKRYEFYDSNTKPKQVVKTLRLRPIDAPWRFQIGAVDRSGSAFGDQLATNIIVPAYGIDEETGKRKRIAAIRITNDGKNLAKLKVTKSLE